MTTPTTPACASPSGFSSPPPNPEAGPLLAALLTRAASLGAGDLRLGATAAGAFACARFDRSGRKLAEFSAAMLDALCALAARCANLTGTARSMGPAQRPMCPEASWASDPQWPALCSRYRFELTLGRGDCGPTAFIRILERVGPPIALDRIGYDAAALEAIRHAIHAPSGLVIVSGPAGSGRVTALYSMLGSIDPQRRSVQTVEARIRRSVPGWLQFVVADGLERPSGGPWGRALRWVVRNGADAILLERIAGPAVVRVAMQAVQAERLVLSTMEPGRARGVITELLRWQVQAVQLLDAVSLVIGQRRIARLCPHCAMPDEREPVRHALAAALNTWLMDHPVSARRAAPAGCAHCAQTGYRGTLLVYELIEIDARARGLIASGIDPVQLESALLAEGCTLWDRGLRHLADGTTSLEALQAAIRQPR
jgi:type II secretory ATPase GspE/PulE/Tfp pilus assembly ATPase PilB-like protein